jgi:predicted GH43/DUF377 family glycosyl hydrolase
VEDFRISANEGAYQLTYSAYSRHGVRIGLARTRDFEKVKNRNTETKRGPHDSQAF